MSSIIQNLSLEQQPAITFNKLEQAILLDQDYIIFPKNKYSHPYTTMTLHSSTQINQLIKFDSVITIKEKQVKIRSTATFNSKILMTNSHEIIKILQVCFLNRNSKKKHQIIINNSGEIAFINQSFITSEIRNKVQTKNSLAAKFLIGKYYKQAISNFIPDIYQITSILHSNSFLQKCTQPEILSKLQVVSYICKFSMFQPPQNQKQQIDIQIQTLQGVDTASLYDPASIKSLQERTTIKQYLRIWEEKLSVGNYKGKKSKIVRVKQLLESCGVSGIKKFEQPKILSYVHFEKFSQIRWGQYRKGGFGSLYYSKTQYFLLHQKNAMTDVSSKKAVEDYFILKRDPNKTKGKVFVEKLIIQQIKNLQCINLPKYFECKQIQDKASVLIQFFALGSLAEWLKSYGKFISIYTRIKICISVTMGVKFLHEQKIVHRDLKLQNILLDKELNAKICDFGESYHPEVAKKLKQLNLDIKPGYTVPYTPIQYFKNPVQTLTEPSYDIFSLGLIIFEIIFDRELFQRISLPVMIKTFRVQSYFQKMNEQSINDYHNEILSKLYLAPEILQNYGPIQVLNPVLNIIRRSLSSDPRHRPALEWIIIVLKQASDMLHSFYSQ